MLVRKLKANWTPRKAVSAVTHSDSKIEAAKKLLDTSAEKNRNLLIAFMAYLATATILALSITDEDLLLGVKTIQLPLLSVGLPMWAFYTVIPFLLVLLHFDVLQNVQEHNKKLDAWWDLLSDKNKADAGTKLFPYILDFARVRYGFSPNPSYAQSLTAAGVWLMYVYLPVFVLAIFFIRFADLQGVGITVFHLLLLILDIGILIRQYWSPSFPEYIIGESKKNRERSASKGAFNFCLTMALAWVFFVWNCIQYLHITPYKNQAPWVTSFIIKTIYIENTTLKLLGDIAIVPRLVVPNAQPYQVKDDDIRLAKWLEPGKTEKQLWESSSPRLAWQDKRLAFSELKNAQMRRANLSGADLQGANLGASNLQDADLRFALLQGADLEKASLQGVDFRGAELHDSRLWDVFMQGANFEGISIQGAQFVNAFMQGVNFRAASLQGSNFKGAILKGADFKDASLQGANFLRSDMQGAYFKNARMQGAKLGGASLQGTDFRFAELRGSQFAGATLSGLFWTDNVDLETRTDFAALIRAYPKLEQHLSETQESQREPPPLPMPFGTNQPGDFAKAWLNILCQDVDSHRSMLKARYKSILVSPVVTKQVLEKYLNSAAHCAAYRELTVNVLKGAE